MASMEFLMKRIEGKETEITKLNKKMERILKAQATNWEVNPYWYSESDIRITQRELDDAKKALEDYKAKLNTEVEKSNSRNIKVLVDFLENWKAKTIVYFKAEKERYDISKKEYYERDREYVEKYNNRSRLGLTKEEVRELEKEHRQYRNNFKREWSHVTQFFHGSRTWEENLERDVEQEKNRKYDDIIERVNAIVGTITDASNLRVGAKGDINGIIIGDRGKAKVQTIGAGGYNIQCFHFRTLVHEVK